MDMRFGIKRYKNVRKYYNLLCISQKGGYMRYNVFTILVVSLLVLSLFLSGCCKSTVKASQNNLDPDYLVTKSPDEILPEESELAGGWNKVTYSEVTEKVYTEFIEKSDYEEVEHHVVGTKASVTLKGEDSERITLTVINFNSTQEAMDEFPDEADGEREEDRVLVGNEMMTTEYSNSAESMSGEHDTWTYQIIFRRNNVLVYATVNTVYIRTVYGEVGRILTYSEKEKYKNEIAEYALLMDEKIN
ncbi:hypothetical protein GF412_02660 [Candidatus Micrarchaeota archaeon]|nr:hypothetical protein [Candidatus Micrarchaeota archaeon]MBD3417860.1 hypothetical protein [Candidatus Micrarchaeota archaeon]